MAKKNLKTDFTAIEVMAIIERLESQFRIFGEVQQGLREKVEATFDMTGKNTEDIDVTKSLVRKTSEDMRLTKLEIILIRQRLDEIKTHLSYKADREEVVRLKDRLAVLERKLKTA